jgi:hypothetical protein
MPKLSARKARVSIARTLGIMAMLLTAHAALAQPLPVHRTAQRAAQPMPPGSSVEQVEPGITINRSPSGKETVKVDLSIRPINSISLNIAPPGKGEVPPNLAMERMRGELPHLLQDRPYEPWNYYWTATSFCHQPLYFEEVNVERYGHNAGCLQPAFSAAHFFVTIPMLPYKMGMDHPCDCVYTLGHSRPGDCNAWERHDLRWSWGGAVAQGAAVTGIIFAMP